MGNVTEKSSHFKKIAGIVHGVHHGQEKWVTDKAEGILKWHQDSIAVKQLIIQWENKEDEISFVLYCKNCATEDNLNGEILVHTKNRYQKVTTIDRESYPRHLLNFVKINKKSVDKDSDIDMIELELKPLFPDQKLPISNAYIRYCLK